MVPNEIRTRTLVARLDTDGILHVTYLPCVEETLADVEENLRLSTAAWGEGPWPILVDVRAVKSLNREVRKYNSRPEVRRRAKAAALLVNSPLSKFIANLLVSLIRSTTPTRLFTDETEALAWLRGFVEG